MQKPIPHPKEKERLTELESYSIMDSFSEEDYDNLTEIAAELCGTSISLVSLVDDTRQWFKSHHGLDATQTPREFAFCAHAINDSSSIFIIEDARKDARFMDNPLVTDNPYVIFYAGVPLVTEKGLPLGTLCVIDNSPKQLSEKQKKSLLALAKQVMNLLELRKRKISLEKALKKSNEQQLKLFAAQLNPNYVQSFICSLQQSILEGNTEKSLLYTSDYSNLIRLVLRNSLELYITLKDEVAFLEKFLKIESARRDNSFTYSIVADLSTIGSKYIPPMVLYPHVENAVSHGMTNQIKNGIIKINISNKGKNLVCSIDDNGAGRCNAVDTTKTRAQTIFKPDGIGVTENRLALYSQLENKTFKIDHIDKYNSESMAVGTTVKILIPGDLSQR